MDPTGLPATVVYAYQWIGVDGRTETNIAGTTSSTYTLTSADQGKKVKARVVFLDSGGNDESLTSEPTATVVAANPTPATGTIAITGSVWVGQTLTATPTNVTDPNGLPDPVYYTYQWIRVDGSTEADIAGATSSTYTLTSADLGKKVKARVTFRDNVSNDETLTSEPTVPVPAGPSPRRDTAQDPVVRHDGRVLDLAFDQRLMVLELKTQPTLYRGLFEVTVDGTRISFVHGVMGPRRMHAALERPDIRQCLTACHELFKFLLALQGASTYAPSAGRPRTCASIMPASVIRPEPGTSPAASSPRSSGIRVSCTRGSGSLSPTWAAPPSGWWRSIISAARLSNGSRRARTRSGGHACRAAGSTTMPFASSFTRSPTTSATSCAHSRCPMPWNIGH